MEEKPNIEHIISESNLNKLITELPKERENEKIDTNQNIKQISSPNISQKFITKYKNEELNQFKDEILSYFKERENNLISKVNYYHSHIESAEKKYEDINKIIKLNYEEILSSQANLNNKLDKFKTYEQFVLKTNDNITSHEIRINNLREDFSKATQKYDKIYLDNLEVPGFIGRCAKYKNCQLFFSDVIKELNKLNNYKEKNNIDLKTYKDKLEKMIKTFKSMVDNNNEAQIKYINKLNEKNINECKNMIDVLGERVTELRLENSKYSVELINKTNKTIEQMNLLKEMKGQLLNEFYNQIEDYKNITNNIVKSFNEFKNEYSIIRKKFLELAEFIKDIRFRKNLGGKINKNEINILYKNLIKKNKKSSKDKNVQLINNISHIEKIIFKENENNSDNNINNNKKEIRGKKRPETYNSTNNIHNIIKENYLVLNGNENKNIHKNREIIQNKNIINTLNNSDENIYKNKTMDFYNLNNEEKDETKIFNNKKTNKKLDLINIVNFDKKLKKIEEKDNQINLLLTNTDKENIDNKEKDFNKELNVINNGNIILINKQNNDFNFNKKELINKEKKNIEFNNKKEKIENQTISNKNNKENIDLNNSEKVTKLDIFKNRKMNIISENKKRDKKYISSVTTETLSVSDSLNSFSNNNTLAGTGTISDKNITMPISYNINNIKCNKFVLNDMLQDEKENRIIKELAAELEQSTAKKIKIFGSQSKKNEENLQKLEIKNIQPINLLNNLKNNNEIENIEIITEITKDQNKYKSKNQINLDSDLNENLEKNEVITDGEKSPKNNINYLLKNKTLKSIINQEKEIDKLNKLDDFCEKNGNKKDKNKKKKKKENNYKNENNFEQINRKLLLFNKKLFDMEAFMKEKFIEIIKQIEYVKQINYINKSNNQINHYRTIGYNSEQKIYNTINNDNNHNNFNFINNGKDENFCTINYHDIKSPRVEIYSKFFPFNGLKTFKTKFNYFKDAILIDNLNKNQNNKNDEISAIKNFIEKKININNSKTLYNDYSKKNLKGIIKNNNINFINIMNGDNDNNDIHSKIKNNSTISGNDMKWIDLKILANKKILKNSSFQKLNPILLGENK